VKKQVTNGLMKVMAMPIQAVSACIVIGAGIHIINHYIKPYSKLLSACYT
jgi:hypothetical protein